MIWRVVVVFFSEPTPVIVIEDKYDEKGALIKCIPDKWTTWNKLEIRGTKTCKQFFSEMFNKYWIQINFLLANGETIVTTLDEESFNANINKLIEEICLSASNIKLKENVDYLILQLSAQIQKINFNNKEYNNVSVEMPSIKYIFK